MVKYSRGWGNSVAVDVDVNKCLAQHDQLPSASKEINTRAGEGLMLRPPAVRPVCPSASNYLVLFDRCCCC